MNYLFPADLIAIHALLLEEFGGLRGITAAGFGRLEAAAAAPRASMFGEEMHGSVVEKAAALCLAIVRSHPFSDGNKRVALVALAVFLQQNDHALTADNTQVYDAIMRLARGDMTRDRLVEWVRAHSSEVTF